MDNQVQQNGQVPDNSDGPAIVKHDRALKKERHRAYELTLVCIRSRILSAFIISFAVAGAFHLEERRNDQALERENRVLVCAFDRHITGVQDWRFNFSNCDKQLP